jgi:hypothetical protein
MSLLLALGLARVHISTSNGIGISRMPNCTPGFDLGQPISRADQGFKQPGFKEKVISSEIVSASLCRLRTTADGGELSCPLRLVRASESTRV